MAETGDLKKIKKKYGEDFMKLCRTLFPDILEEEGRLYALLESCFAGNSRTLYEDLVNNKLENVFKSYIYSKVDTKDFLKKIAGKKTPYELLEGVGYKLKECLKEKDIQKFKHYYAPGERLCTFKDSKRLERCIVFFAVKKDADKIRREDFTQPKREDEYGTSVIGIQFNREGKCTVSIKNRYNHTVDNPDATYGNDLDRITPGLTESFARLLEKRGLKLDSNNRESFSIPNYVVANDGRYYKYNMEINGTYYCPGNIIIKNGEVHEIENPERKILIDYFILDIENKTIKLCNPRIGDSFVDGLQDIEKIDIRNDKEKRTRKITIQQKEKKQPVIIEIDKDNQIIGYENLELTRSRR